MLESLHIWTKVNIRLNDHTCRACADPEEGDRGSGPPL